ncbi:MAG: 1-acyl-sn-glycerol-3-phosphate acyltransferase [Candidatus Lindowbacteria bacterium]|nr:1-acyl-sn-glycerol-3-phosphate acyltransferase [Candidatus Lindowbacteria bacterium]
MNHKKTVFYQSMLLLVKLVMRTFFGLSTSHIEGRENIPSTGGFLFASNHASYLDPPLLAVASPRQIGFVAKIELFSNPLFGWCIRNLGAHPINRDTGARGAMKTAVELLGKDWALVIFPEGTRSLDGNMATLKMGTAMVAMKARVPIIPVYIKGSYAAWPKGGKPRPEKISIRIGEPIQTEGLEDSKKTLREITDKLEVKLKKLEEELS